MVIHLYIWDAKIVQTPLNSVLKVLSPYLLWLCLQKHRFQSFFFHSVVMFICTTFDVYSILVHCDVNDVLRKEIKNAHYHLCKKMSSNKISFVSLVFAHKRNKKRLIFYYVQKRNNGIYNVMILRSVYYARRGKVLWPPGKTFLLKIISIIKASILLFYIESVS